jgi:hypothetical protein
VNPTPRAKRSVRRLAGVPGKQVIAAMLASDEFYAKTDS